MHAAIGSQCKLMNRDVCVRVVFACECGVFVRVCGVRVFVRVCGACGVCVYVVRVVRVVCVVHVWCGVRVHVCVRVFLSQDMQRLPEAIQYIEKASVMYVENGTPDTAAMALDRAGKCVLHKPAYSAGKITLETLQTMLFR